MAEAPEDRRKGWALLAAISECVKSKDVDRLEQLLDDNRKLIERLEASLRTDNDGSRQEETNAEDTNEDPPPSEEEPPLPPAAVQPAVDTSTEASESGSSEEQQQQQQHQDQAAEPGPALTTIAQKRSREVTDVDAARPASLEADRRTVEQAPTRSSASIDLQRGGSS